LTQSAIFSGIDLGALIIEVFILDKRAPLRIEKVICAGKRIERQVCVICSATSVDWDSTGYGVLNLDPGRFGIVNADARTQIRLESLVPRRESQDEVRQERARIDPSGHVALCYNVIKGIEQGEVSATAKAIVKEVAFDRGTNYARAKDVTEFDAAEETDVIFWVHLETVAKKIPVRIILCKSSVVSAVLKDVCPRVDRTVKAESIQCSEAAKNPISTAVERYTFFIAIG